MSTESVLAEVRAEREKQDARWGPQDHSPAEWLAILTEEVGEVSTEILKHRFGGRALSEYRLELVQVAAVAVAAIEALDKGNQ